MEKLPEGSRHAAPHADGDSSTPIQDRQRQREQREAERSGHVAANQDARLRAGGRMAATAAGRALFREHAESVSVRLGLRLEELVANPGLPGPHHAAWPLLPQATGRGPRTVALIALETVIDALGQELEESELGQLIGLALQAELRAGRLEQRSRDLLRLIKKRRGAKAIADPAVLRRVAVKPDGWTGQDRQAVGLLLLDVVRTSGNLIERRVITRRGRPCVIIRATPETAAAMLARPSAPPSRRQAMLVPPRPWEGMLGGGHLTSREPLVRSRAGLDLSHLTPAALAPVLQSVNYLQQQQVRVNGQMVAIQRQAWDAGLRGLFPCGRDPLEPPSPPRETVGADAMRAWRRERFQASADRREWAATRKRIEQSLAQAEEIADAPAWFAWCADFRGRLYTTNRHCTHQGPDWEKAAIELQAEPCPPEAMDWLLWAAAGHWGSRASWPARLRWGREAVPRMVAAAEDPLNRLELWRDAKDPWQFLQLCQAVAQQVANPGSPTGVPIRFDQTCSGAAIVACLLRDRSLARLTNVVGTTPLDLYRHVAEILMRRLQVDLCSGTGRQRRLAEFWLEFGVDRSLVKGPTMTSLYGASHQGLTDSLAAAIQARRMGAIEQWERWCIQPAQFLAQHIRSTLKAELASALALEQWLRQACRVVVSSGSPVQWTSPMGLPVRLGALHDGRSKVQSLSRGSRRWQTWQDHAIPGELSARATGRGVAPNVIHSFDAALCQAVVITCAAHKAQVLPNHDCFATTPSNAAWLHLTLSVLLRGQYLPDWLLIMADEIACNAGGLQLPAPPSVGSLCPGEVGNNRHHFC